MANVLPLVTFLVDLFIVAICLGILIFNWFLVRRSDPRYRLQMAFGYLAGMLVTLVVILLDQISGGISISPADPTNLPFFVSYVISAGISAMILMLIFRLLLRGRAIGFFVLLTIMAALVSPYFVLTKPQIGNVLAVLFLGFLVGVTVYIMIDTEFIELIRQLLRHRELED